ncbi:hypothetical protein INR49_022986, partial [Caranx melampygus]
MWKVLVVVALAAQHVTGKTLKYQIYEEQKVGTVIARLKDDVADVLAKLPSSVSLRFRAMQRGSSRVDYETINSYDIDVQAQDMGPNSMPAHCKILVKVVDVNDNKPDISINLMSAQGNGDAAYISEASALDTFVALVRVEDLDSGLNGEVECKLHGQGYFKLQKTYENNYMILTNVSLDREKRATDRDTGVNAELICSIVGGNEEGFFLIDPRTCEIHANASLENFPQESAELTVVVRDQGSESLSAKAVLKITLYENMENHVQVMDQGESTLDTSLIIIISLGAICGVLLVIMVVFAAHCNREKKETRHSYNCRVAESTHQHHPKKPSRQIHKGDITLVPTVNGTLPIRAHHRSPSATPPMDRAQMGSRQNHHSRQSLNSLVTISSNHIPESFALELAHATPPVEQVSQLLSMLHQGQYQPRPSFRGNKYSRSYRYALQDMDKFSLKDSGRGDSEAGDSDCDMGRESPVDRLLLGEGFSDLIHLEMHHRLHPAMRLCTDECRVLGHSDQCWMPPLSSPASSSDYRNNMYIPGEESAQQPQLDDDQSSVDSERRKSFSTFGKESGSEEAGAGGVIAGGGSDACAAGGGAGSLLTEMNSVFQRLLPPNMDSYTECNETSPPSSSSTTERGSGRGGNVAGVAAWAANTHYLNPGSGSVGTNHVSSSSSSSSSSSPSSSTSTTTSTNGQPPHLKWLPAMEEIPENYEEDDFDAVFHQGHQGGKRSENHHEAGMDASELVHEINKLLQD